MAELVATMVVGPLLSIVQDKTSSYILDKYKVMEGMEEQHRVLKRKLPAILDVIDDAEQVASKRAGVKAWLEDVKRVAYEANEVFDEFNYEALRREAKKNGHYSKLGFDAVKLFPTHNRYAFRDKMGKKLCRVVQDIEVLVAEMNAFGFKYQEQAPSSMQWRQTDPVIFDPKKIISRSRDQDSKNIVNMLLDHASNENLMVLPIVGVGGLGKTTFVQLIYNEPKIQKHFELMIWVCVSDNFDVDSLANSIVEAANPNKSTAEAATPNRSTAEAATPNRSTAEAATRNRSTAEATSKKRPLDRLQEVLSGRRYLLVLDDVWNRESNKWEELKDRLTHDAAKGCVVLPTTRDEGVAKIMGTDKACNLAGLKDNFIHEIIETRAFSLQKEEKRPAVLVNMVGEIVKRCHGSPLAATALGSVLSTKTSEEEWKDISRRSNICTEEFGILPILKLSYNDLSSQMKQCFAFCAVFPKDYEIDVDKLIQLWIAHGFIQDQKEVRAEIIGKQIFSELVSRSFFVNVKKARVSFGEFERQLEGSCYSKHTCKIHDLMHDVALSTMEKECALAPEEPSKSEWLPETARHLLLPYEKPDIILNDSLARRSPAIQTLLCDRSLNHPLQHLSKYSSLKALMLYSRRRRWSFPLKSKHLHHLRYLDLTGSNIKALPEDISILYNLQTLNVSGCRRLRRLPRQMKYMTALRHLYTHGCPRMRSMPGDLGKLVSLQTLTCFVAGPTGSECSGVGELQQLNIGGELELHQLENVTKEDAKAANLGKKKELRVLTLKWTTGCNDDVRIESYEDSRVLEGLEPHDVLQAVRIESYGGTTFPTWMAMSRNLIEIHLSYCKKLQWLFSCGTSLTFPNLKEFTLRGLECLEGLWEITNEEQDEEIIFPQLEKLCVIGCPKLTMKAKSPKLTGLDFEGGEEQIFLWVARYMTSLTNLNLRNRKDTETTSAVVAVVADLSLTQMVDEERWNHHDFPLAEMSLDGLKSDVTELCACFVQLQHLCIKDCAALVHWPKEFQNLVSLRSLRIESCKQLVGYAQAPTAEPSTTSESSSPLLPCLESLKIQNCRSMVEIFKLPASLREMEIHDCTKLKSIFTRRLQQGQSTSSNLQGSPVHSEVSSSSSVSRAEHLLFPYLEKIDICFCDSLTGVLDLPPSLKKITVLGCGELRSVQSHSGKMEGLWIGYCETLSSLPDGPQAYASLQSLMIKNCPGIKRLPTCLQQRLSGLEYKYKWLDARYEEPSFLKPKTWINVIR